MNEIGTIQTGVQTEIDESQREGQRILSDMRGYITALSMIHNSLCDHADATFGVEPNSTTPEEEIETGKDIPFVSQRNGLNRRICQLIAEIETQVKRSRFF